MFFVCARRAKTTIKVVYRRTEKYLITKVVFLRFCGRLFPTLTFWY